MDKAVKTPAPQARPVCTCSVRSPMTCRAHRHLYDPGHFSSVPADFPVTEDNDGGAA